MRYKVSMVPTPASGRRRIVKLEDGGGSMIFDLGIKSPAHPDCCVKELTLSDGQLEAIRHIRWITVEESDEPVEDPLAMTAEEMIAANSESANDEPAKKTEDKSKKGKK